MKLWLTHLPRQAQISLFTLIFTAGLFSFPPTTFAQDTLDEGPLGQKGLLTPSANETEAKAQTSQDGLFLEYIDYEESVYSVSRKTELGDRLKLNTSLRYQFNPETFGRLRFSTDPAENRQDNKTSKFEFLAGHIFNDFYAQIDAELNTNDGTGGGTTIGMDLDSKGTFVSYAYSDRWLLTFYPFNFGSNIGREFQSGEVNRLYFITGSPNAVTLAPTGSEEIASKTIPGLELSYASGGRSNYGFIGSLAIGAATYLYPGDESFDILTSPTANRWERKESLGYKAKLRYQTPDLNHEWNYVTHSQSDEAGSLMSEAANIYTLARLASMMLEFEWSWSRAGEKPYRLNRNGKWFLSENQLDPLYQDINRNIQDWVGKTGQAFHLKIGLETEGETPYLSYKFQDKNFVFEDRESAHLLRTGDESASHGGLHRYGIGSYFYRGNFVIIPQLEYLMAKNPVFGNSTDVRNDRKLGTFKKEDFSVYLQVRYEFDGPQLFKPE